MNVELIKILFSIYSKLSLSSIIQMISYEYLFLMPG